MSKKISKIEVETVLLPWVIAGQIIREVAVYLQREISEDLERHLCDRAQRIYENNERFRKQVRGGAGREYLYSFMRHWSAAWVYEEYGVRMPGNFCNGVQLHPSERYEWPKGWTLADVLAQGLTEMDIQPTITLPSLSKIQKFKVHQSFRLADGLWHCFRYTDEKKAADRDRELSGPMLPKSKQ